MRLTRLLFTVVLAAISGCAQVPLDTAVDLPASSIRLVDNRTAEMKAHRRDSIFSAVSYMDDNQFFPRALDLFQAALLSNANVVKPVLLEVDEFHIVDFFPRRAGEGPTPFDQALMTWLTEMNTDRTLVRYLAIPDGTDALLCVFSGRINGKPVKVIVAEPYKTSPWAGLIVNDPDFRRALLLVIQQAATAAAKPDASSVAWPASPR